MLVNVLSRTMFSEMFFIALFHYVYKKCSFAASAPYTYKSFYKPMTTVFTHTHTDDSCSNHSFSHYLLVLQIVKLFHLFPALSRTMLRNIGRDEFRPFIFVNVSRFGR